MCLWRFVSDFYRLRDFSYVVWTNKYLAEVQNMYETIF